MWILNVCIEHLCNLLLIFFPYLLRILICYSPDISIFKFEGVLVFVCSQVQELHKTVQDVRGLTNIEIYCTMYMLRRFHLCGFVKSALELFFIFFMTNIYIFFSI